MEILERLASDSFWARCVKACSWVTAGSISTQIIRGGRWIIITYLLAPEEIGLIILVWSVLGLLQELSDTGIKHAIIQNPRGLEDKYANSAWLMNLARGGILMVIMYFIVPILTQNIFGTTNSLYGKPQLTTLLKLSCLIIAFDSLTSISMVLMRKNLKFGPVTKVVVIGHITGTIATIILTWVIREARGVILGEAVTSLTICILSYKLSPYRPQWRWSGTAAKALISYGLIAYLVTLVDAVGTRMDILILGGIAQETDVALYGLGMVAISAPCQVFSMLTVAVGFPAFSLIQHDRDALKKGIRETVQVIQMFSLPLFAVIALLAPDIVKILPEKYAGTGAVLRWLSIYGLGSVFLRQMTPVLYAVNRVIWCVVRAGMQVIIIAILIVPLYRHMGLSGACWARNSALIVTDIFIWMVVLRELNWPWRQWFKDISMLGRALIAGGAATAITCGLLWLTGYEWSSYYWVRWLSCLGGVAGFIAVGVRHYIRNEKKYLISIHNIY